MELWHNTKDMRTISFDNIEWRYSFALSKNSVPSCQFTHGEKFLQCEKLFDNIVICCSVEIVQSANLGFIDHVSYTQCTDGHVQKMSDKKCTYFNATSFDQHKLGYD